MGAPGPTRDLLTLDGQAPRLWAVDPRTHGTEAQEVEAPAPTARDEADPAAAQGQDRRNAEGHPDNAQPPLR